jgi:phosphopantetheinyl transferase (holo-ACP synthase)
VTRRRATRWTKEAQTKRWIKWTKFAIGFKDIEMINDHKVIDAGQLGRFSDKEAAVA